MPLWRHCVRRHSCCSSPTHLCFVRAHGPLDVWLCLCTRSHRADKHTAEAWPWLHSSCDHLWCSVSACTQSIPQYTIIDVPGIGRNCVTTNNQQRSAPVGYVPLSFAACVLQTTQQQQPAHATTQLLRPLPASRWSVSTDDELLALVHVCNFFMCITYEDIDWNYCCMQAAIWKSVCVRLRPALAQALDRGTLPKRRRWGTCRHLQQLLQPATALVSIWLRNRYDMIIMML